MFTGFRLAAASTHGSFGSKCALYAPRSQAPVRSRVRSVNWRCESEEWKRVKARPGGEVVMAQSWAPVVEADQARAHVAFCAAFKADQVERRVARQVNR